MDYYNRRNGIVNIKDMTNEQLKALAYDEMMRGQVSQRNVSMINQELASRMNGKNPLVEDNSGEEIAEDNA